MDLKIKVGNCDRDMLVDFVAHFNAATEATVLDMLQEKGFEYDKELSAAEVTCCLQNRIYFLHKRDPQ